MGKHCTAVNAEKQHTWLSSEDVNVPQAHWKPSNMLLISELMGICVGSMLEPWHTINQLGIGCGMYSHSVPNAG